MIILLLLSVSCCCYFIFYLESSFNDKNIGQASIHMFSGSYINCFAHSV